MTSRFAIRFLLFVVAGATAGADFPAPFNTETTPGDPMPAAEAAATIQLPSGFRANVFAAEPDVRNPIAMSWDTRGRLWIAENFTYAEHRVRFEESLRDRILIFDDEDRDGMAGAPTVFADDLQHLTGLEVGPDGVYAMCPPRLLFLPDRDRDDQPDGTAEVLLDGFTVPPANHHNFANGLRLHADGWLYGRCGASAPGEVGAPGTPADQRIPLRGTIWRYHPKTKVFEALAGGTTNPWGHDWNEDGDLFFINTVNGHFWHLIPGARYLRPHTLDPNPHVYEAIDMHADHWHFDTAGSWTKSRDGAADAFGGGHAHCGLLILRGKTWPETYRGKAFTLNFHGRRINVERIERHGAGYIARHEPDFAIWQDPFFRGMELSEGPDGAVYVIDWSDTGECHENTGVHRESGRIYRIAHGDAAVPFPRDLTWRDRPAPKPDSFVALTQHWPMDTAYSKRPSRPEASPEEIDHALERPATPPELGSVLQRLPVERRLAVAGRLVGQTGFAADHNLPHLVWYGLIPVAESDPMGLADLAGTTTWPTLHRLIARRLTEDLGTRPEPVSRLLGLASSGPAAFRAEVIRGMAQATAGWRKASAPAGWESFVARAEPSDALRELQILFGDGRALEEVRRIALDGATDLGARKAALRSLIEGGPDDLEEVCRQLVKVRFLNVEAARGLALSDDPEAARALVGAWRQFHPEDRPAFFAALTSRPAFAAVLLDALEAGDIAKTDLTAYHARQIGALGNPALTERLARVWGRLGSGSGHGAAAVAEWKGRLTPELIAGADKSGGRLLYQTLCATCHRLYGEGGDIGPELTGSGRDNLDYLLENILDPGAVVTADYQLSVLTLRDGRVLTGMIRARTEQTLTLQTMTAPEMVPADLVERIETAPVSLMPEGLTQALTPDQFRDLIGYLMHPTQVPLPEQ